MHSLSKMNQNLGGQVAPDGVPFPWSDSSNATFEQNSPNYHTNATMAPSKPCNSIEDRIRLKRKAAAAAAAAADEDSLIDPSLLVSSSTSSLLSSSSSSGKPLASDSDNDDSSGSSLPPSISSSRYKPHISAILDEWVQFEDQPVAQELVLLGAMLDILNNSSHVKAYKIPPGLKERNTNLRKYTFGIVLSPILTAYRGNVIPAVLNTMRELNLTNVPDSKDEDQIKIVGTEIRSLATEVHNIIKAKLVNSTLPDKKVNSHISDVTHAILAAAACGL
ncbi:hypothetical protein JB92DRAFT_3141784 [Gautieria morchelliformis]|nr:hypothetical protein JB92DRAFT_3141784 [Gautieria morchelliformis]